MAQRFLPYVLPLLYIIFLFGMFIFFQNQLTWTTFIIATVIYIGAEMALRFQLSKGKKNFDDYDRKDLD